MEFIIDIMLFFVTAAFVALVFCSIKLIRLAVSVAKLITKRKKRQSPSSGLITIATDQGILQSNIADNDSLKFVSGARGAIILSLVPLIKLL